MEVMPASRKMPKKVSKNFLRSSAAVSRTHCFKVRSVCWLSGLVSETSPDSQQTDLTLKQWVRETSAEERKKFFDTFFGIFLDAGITSINDLTDLKQLAKSKEILQNAQDLDPTEREMLERLAKQLIDTRFQAWKKWQTVPRILVQMATFFKRKQAVETTSPLRLEHKE